jgi:hypothetical protein
MGALNTVVIPALNVVASLLRGDFSEALSGARTLVTGFISTVVSLFTGLAGRVFGALASLSSRIGERIGQAASSGLRAIRDFLSDAVDAVQDFPDSAANALGNLDDVLYNAGRALIRGFIQGIRSLASAARDAVGDIIDGVTGLLPGSPAEYGPLSGRGYVLYRGQAFSEDFARGIEDNQRAVITATRGLALSASQGLSTAPLGALPLGTTLAQPAIALPPTTVQLTVVNQGILGSRTEVLDWLTDALDELRRQQRLGVTI